MEAPRDLAPETAGRGRNWRWRVGTAIGSLTVGGMVLVFSLVVCRARGAFKALSCHQNLVSVQAAVHMYATDYADRYPPAANWCGCDVTWPYVRGTWCYTCPALGDDRGGYALNASLAGIPTRDIEDPYGTVLLFDGPPGWNMAGGRDAVVLRHPSLLGSGHWEVALADGHVTGASDPNAHRWAP